MGLKSKFGAWVNRCGMGKATENFHMVIRGCFMVKNGKKGFVVKERCGEAIDEVSCNKNTFPPKIL